MNGPSRHLLLLAVSLTAAEDLIRLITELMICFLVCSDLVDTTVKFVLLHDMKNEDGIRLFFMDVWEGYVKVSCSPVSMIGFLCIY